MRIWAVAVAFALAFFAVDTYGQTQRFRVKVQVTASAELKSDLESYLTRELRSLGDVDITDGPASQFMLEADFFEVRLKDGKGVGYAASYQFIEVVDCGGKIYFDLMDSGLQVGALESLRGMASSQVTDVDNHVFKLKRKKIL